MLVQSESMFYCEKVKSSIKGDKKVKFVNCIIFFWPHSSGEIPQNSINDLLAELYDMI